MRWMQANAHAHHTSDHITASLCICNVQSCSLQQQLITDRIQHLALSTGYNHTTAVLKWYSCKSVRWSFLIHDPEDDTLPLSQAALQEAVVGEKVDVTGSECGSGGTVFLWMLIGLKFCLPQYWWSRMCIKWAALWALSDSGCLMKSREQLFLVYIASTEDLREIDSAVSQREVKQRSVIFLYKHKLNLHSWVHGK